MVDNIWIVSGMFGVIGLNFCCIFLALNARAHVRKLKLAVYDLDWSAVGDLVVDVQKLKKQVQRYRNIENGEQHTQTDKLIKDLENQYHSRKEHQQVGKYSNGIRG